MKIRLLHLEHFRKFTEPMKLTGLTDGVNILAECNEFGKSTILAAIRGVLFERHSSKAKSVVSMQHQSNKTSPIITLEFELAGKVYRIEKRFLKESYAKLSMPDGSVHHGDAAEEELQKILNFTRAGNTGATPDTIGMWGALWVPQRHSVDQAALPESARQTIHGCLESEVGALAGGTRGTALINGTKAEIATLLDGHNKPLGRYKEALDELARGKEHLEQLEAKHRALINDIADLQAAKRKLTETDEGGQNAETEALLTQAQKDREAAQRYEDQEKIELANLQLAENRLAEAQKEVDARSQKQAEITQAEGRCVAATETEAKEATTLKLAKAALDRQRALLADATEDFDDASEALRLARTQDDLAASAKVLEGLEKRLQQADRAQVRLNDLSTQLGSFTVNKESLSAARTIHGAIQQTQAALEAQATHISLELLPNTTDLIRVNGSMNSSTGLVVIADTNIDIEGIGRICVRPGIKDRETLLARLDDKRRELRNALRAISVETVEEAEDQLALRQQCEQDSKQARAEVTLCTPADAGQKIPAGVEALRNHVNVIRGALDAKLAGANLEKAPEPEAARDSLRTAELHEQEGSTAVAVARAPIAELELQDHRVLKSHTQAETEVKTAKNDREKLGREYEQALVRESVDALSERLRIAANAFAAQRGLLEQMQSARPVDSVVNLDARIKRYLNARQQFFDDRTQTEQSIAILGSRIEREEGIGIEEQIATARRVGEDLDSRCIRYGREISVLQLLRRTLLESEHVAKERYMAPVVRRVTPYLQTLFPGSAITCDENFQITGVVREQQQAEGFGVLSVGTQEQD